MKYWTWKNSAPDWPGALAGNLAQAGIALYACIMREWCVERGMTNPHRVACPCACGGTLRSDGRNKGETLTFLQCDGCACTYVADDMVPS